MTQKHIGANRRQWKDPIQDPQSKISNDIPSTHESYFNVKRLGFDFDP